ncbi:HAD family hydrolase [Tannockella kyphosi]|uniref:HAD family hydrolase n=1 Tax=Tannockella kyphosi TaxID=2899121 RepID=UPI0020117AB2|nr:HAD family phosphatase [Tannockella kyphosi]
MIKAVLFDMDGVLIESEIEYMKRFVEVFRSKNIIVREEDFYCLVGASSPDSLETFDKLAKPISGAKMMSLCAQSILDNPFAYKEIRTENIYELLRDLKEDGYKIAVASATSRQGIQLALKETSLDQFVDVYYSGDDCPRSKPFPDVYLKVMELLDVTPEQCVILEDSKPGIQAATSAGGYVVAREVPIFPIDQSLASEKIRDVYDLYAIVKKLDK